MGLMGLLSEVYAQIPTAAKSHPPGRRQLAEGDAAAARTSSSKASKPADDIQPVRTGGHQDCHDGLAVQVADLFRADAKHYVGTADVAAALAECPTPWALVENATQCKHQVVRGRKLHIRTELTACSGTPKAENFYFSFQWHEEAGKHIAENGEGALIYNAGGMKAPARLATTHPINQPQSLGAKVRADFGSTASGPISTRLTGAGTLAASPMGAAWVAFMAHAMRMFVRS